MTHCRCIIKQQINLTFAYKLKRKLVEKFGITIIYELEKYLLFPSPEVLALAIVEDLHNSFKNKVTFLIGVAAAKENRELSREILMPLLTFEEQQKLLM
ncbi:MAG: hypothetical protein H7296_10025 [Bacteroidia bacterium]|nr:hypothetical protein [Bacteroidia bacterium]